MVSRPHFHVAICMALAIPAAPLSAQETIWHHDYNAARQKAAAEKKPIVMDFGTANCFWCKKLDVTTFRDPAVMKRLGEQFIAVKIDADKDAALAQHLGISSYPTLVFAAHDGRILGQNAGYVETAQFMQQLDRALSDDGKTPDAVVVAPPSAPRTPVQLVEPAAAQPASAMLVQIRADYAARRYVICLERCKELAASDLSKADAMEAQRIERSIQTDPEKLAVVQAALVESLGNVYLANAEAAIRDRRWQDAKQLLERVQELCPASPQALAAKHHDLRLRAQMPAQPIFRMQAP